MSKRRKIFIWMAIGAAVAGMGAGISRLRHRWPRRSPMETIQITGTVLRQNKDPRKQSPIANAEITATGGLFDVDAKSDSSGLFRIFLRPSLRRQEPIVLRFEHAEYKPVEITGTPDGRLHIVRMDALVPEPTDEFPVEGRTVSIQAVRVRYTLKDQTTMNVGSVAKQFAVVNAGNIPCGGQRICSPDGKWRGTIGSMALDAEEGNQFRNVRVTCIAGPCPFTKIDPGDLSRPARTIRISVLNWSDQATFLVEAEVTRTAVADTIRRSYPTIIAQTMTFALPAGAEGPTVEAEVNGEAVVYPLGPRLILSWANCGVEIAPGQNRTYRCELKPGYRFAQ